MRTCDRRPLLLLPIVPMSVCTNLGLDRSSRLAAYADYVAHQCALAIADHPIFIALSQCLCEFWTRSVQSFGRLYWTCDAVHTFVRAARAWMLADTPIFIAESQ
jgi:hypothetical protein